MELTIEEKLYYQKALQKNRLFPFWFQDRFVGFITFYIENDIKNYGDIDSWRIVNDNPFGSICVVQQLLTDKDIMNPKLSYSIWRDFKKYIRDNFKNVEFIKWKRFKGGKIYVYYQNFK